MVDLQGQRDQYDFCGLHTGDEDGCRSFSRLRSFRRDLGETCHLFFSTLANPTRLAILELLREESRNVSQLSEALRQEQSMVSHNLKPLTRCRFVLAKRRGKERRYSLNRETMEPLFKIIEDHAEKYCPTRGKCLELRRET